MNPEQEQYLLTRAKLWTPELDKLLRKWKQQVNKRYIGHLYFARKFKALHYTLGVPSIILGSIISSGILATFQNCDSCDDLKSAKCQAEQWIRFSIGILGVFATILATLLTFLDFQGRSENHKTAADDFGNLNRDLEAVLMIPGHIRGDPVATLNDYRIKYSELCRRSPTLSKEYDGELTYKTVAMNVPFSPPKRPNLETQNVSVQNDNQILKNMFETESDQSYEDQLEKAFDSKISSLNNHDTDDEEDVCIGFDLDAAKHPPVIDALKFAEAKAKQEQESVQRALQFEMRRLNSSMNGQQKPLSLPNDTTGGCLHYAESEAETHGTETD